MILFTCHNGFMCNSMYKKGELPGAPLTNFNDEGGEGEGAVPREVYILYPKKSQLQNFSANKNQYVFLAYPQNPIVLFSATPKKSLCFIRDPKNPGVFHRPKKSLLAKIFDSIKSFNPPAPVIKICEWGPWGRAFSWNVG